MIARRSPVYWTTGQLARALGMAPSTVRRWCEAGELAARATPGGHWRIPVAVVVALLGPAVRPP